MDPRKGVSERSVSPLGADRDWEMCVSCRPHLPGQWWRQDAIRAIRGLTCQETQIPFVSPPANTRTGKQPAKKHKSPHYQFKSLPAERLSPPSKNVINGLKPLRRKISAETAWIIARHNLRNDPVLRYSDFMLGQNVQMLWQSARENSISRIMTMAKFSS